MSFVMATKQVASKPGLKRAQTDSESQCKQDHGHTHYSTPPLVIMTWKVSCQHNCSIFSVKNKQICLVTLTT